jgi:hypothetical protein
MRKKCEMRARLKNGFAVLSVRCAGERGRRSWNLCCLPHIRVPGGDRLTCISIRGEVYEIGDLHDRTSFRFGYHGFRLRQARKTGRTFGGGTRRLR